MESGVVDNYISMLKLELGFLKLESLQALSNGGLEIEEILALVMCLLDDLIKLNLSFYKVNSGCRST